MKPETLLLRQIHPNFFNDGTPSSQAFVPFPKDKGKLSVYDGDKITAAESHKHYTGILKYESRGVWGVACEEATKEELRCESDPLKDFPAHALIDFSAHNAGRHRTLAKRLRDHAVRRKCLYSAE